MNALLRWTARARNWQRRRNSLRAQRDLLLNERDKLYVRLQELARKAEGSDRFDVCLPFPERVLPGGTAPLVTVIDVGAQNLSSSEHVYHPLLRANAARVVGFEPLKEEANRRAEGEADLVMLNYFIGDGTSRTFHINEDNATSSLLPANTGFLSRFEALHQMLLPRQIEHVQTTRLDEVPEAAQCDYLKIDVQGGELDVLRGAPNVLTKTVVVHTEVEFSAIYRDQPLFGDIDEHLRTAGFELVDLRDLGYSTVKGLSRPLARSRLLWADAIYMRTPKSLQLLGAEKIWRAAYIAHVNYGMYDIAAEILSLLGVPNLVAEYGASLVQPRQDRHSATEARTKS